MNNFIIISLKNFVGRICFFLGGAFGIFCTSKNMFFGFTSIKSYLFLLLFIALQNIIEQYFVKKILKWYKCFFCEHKKKLQFFFFSVFRGVNWTPTNTLTLLLVKYFILFLSWIITNVFPNDLVLKLLILFVNKMILCLFSANWFFNKISLLTPFLAKCSECDLYVLN